MAKQTNETEQIEHTIKNYFTKEQIIESNRYKFRKDILNVLLESGKTYTLDEVDRLLENFMKGKVK